MCKCKCEDPKKIKVEPDACDSKQIKECTCESQAIGTKDIQTDKKPSGKCSCES